MVCNEWILINMWNLIIIKRFKIIKKKINKCSFLGVMLNLKKIKIDFEDFVLK